MKTLSVLVHFDPHGEAAPHVLRHAQALASVSDSLIIVSTAELTSNARAALENIGTVIQRENVGYDFYSWRAGLLSTDWDEYSRIVLANDSVVGPLRPMPEILREMERRDVDMWGATLSREIRTHVQSFFMAFNKRVISSPFFRAFWSGMLPLSDRKEVILRYEIGLSHLLTTAGFRLGAYFEPEGWDRRVAAIRTARVTALQAKSRPWGPMVKTAVAPPDELGSSTPVFSLWDRALQDGRLPYVKIRFLRGDPYRIGSETALRRCEERYPEAFQGVREFLKRTNA